MDSVTKPFQYLDAHEEMGSHYHSGSFDLMNFSGDAQSCYQNSDIFHQAYGEQLTNMNSFGGPAPASGSKVSLESYHDSESNKWSMSPYIVETPLTSCSTGGSGDFCNSFEKTHFMNRSSSFFIAEQYNTTSAQAPVQVSPYAKLLSTSQCSENLGTTYSKASNSLKSCVNLPIMHHGLSPDSPSSRKLHDSMLEPRSSTIAKTCISDAEKIGLPLAGLSYGESSSLLCSFAPELFSDVVNNPLDLTPEIFLSMHPKNVQVQLKHVADDAAIQINESMASVRSASSRFNESDNIACSMNSRSSAKQVEHSISAAVNSLALESERNDNSSLSSTRPLSDNDLFEGVGLDMRPSSFLHELWDDVSMPIGDISCSNMGADISDCISAMETGSIHGASKGLFSDSGLQQLLDAVVVNSVNKTSVNRSGAKYVHSVSGLNLEHQFSPIMDGPREFRKQPPSVGLPSLSGTSKLLLSNPDIVHGSSKQTLPNSNICSWIDDSCSINTEGSAMNQSIKPEESAKVKKRARPGESTRPRPKDRQQIQDRLKELREIVPNGAKCSIDALLDKTIKHMLFLQSVTKYADKLKQADEPKIIREESGVVMKDNPGGVTGGGATWAYEVAGQTMVCPIIVEDLTPPGQMLVEMLCEERGLFLEIADIIRGFGLIILKGVMEIRECKIWARFLVEANREVTRMDIFLSLIQLLQQNSCLRSGDLITKVVDKEAPQFPSCHQSPISIPAGIPNRLQ
ncbi:hypothetical protein Cni_G16270 [Canna indica]|uniref:BHLH domain-containing protein n=1 Tax=Canna indica TaxID=4628 RepID=A0AAQ3KKR9_9LILI|nr:hypothetical protein Cni_G16270 [Canna indica]